MKIWGFRREAAADSDFVSEGELVSTGEDGGEKRSRFLSDVQESLPEANRANAKRLAIGIALFLLSLALVWLALSAVYRYWDVENTGYLGVLIANFVSSMGVMIPLPFSAGTTVTIAVAGVSPPLLVGLVAAVGGTLGEFTAYWLGYGGERVIHFRGHPKYEVAERWMARRGGLAIAVFAFLPFFMFDFVAVAAGALGYPFHKFMIFCFIGRLPRGLLEAFLGVTIWDWVSPHLPEWMTAPFG